MTKTIMISTKKGKNTSLIKNLFFIQAFIFYYDKNLF
jgi:hypothetical protein